MRGTDPVGSCREAGVGTDPTAFESHSELALWQAEVQADKYRGLGAGWLLHQPGGVMSSIPSAALHGTYRFRPMQSDTRAWLESRLGKAIGKRDMELVGS